MLAFTLLFHLTFRVYLLAFTSRSLSLCHHRWARGGARSQHSSRCVTPRLNVLPLPYILIMLHINHASKSALQLTALLGVVEYCSKTVGYSCSHESSTLFSLALLSPHGKVGGAIERMAALRAAISKGRDDAIKREKEESDQAEQDFLARANMTPAQRR